MGNITFGSFIAEKRKAHKFNLRDTAKHLNIAYGYLCDIEQSRRPAPNGDFVERISAFLNLDKSEYELLLQNNLYIRLCNKPYFDKEIKTRVYECKISIDGKD